ncbi:hypothetical protein LXL04_017771 [Taraxacum kok-saghyz]
MNPSSNRLLLKRGIFPWYLICKFLIRFQLHKNRLKPEPVPEPALTDGSVIGTISGHFSGSVLQPVRDGSGRDGTNAHP